MAKSESAVTTDHDEIRKWVEDRGGRPVIVKRTEDERGSGLLRIDFGDPEKEFEEIDWESFFKIFEERKLAFLYQEQTADGHESRFFKFVSREGK